MPLADLISLARSAAVRHALDAALVCAVCEQESAWNPWAVRYEPAFYARYIAPLVARNEIRSQTEATARAFSWGLMQVMGQVAREHGFDAPFLSALCDPECGLEFGCRVLAAKIKSAAGDLARALLLWNGGANPNYPDEVLSRRPRYRSGSL